MDSGEDGVRHPHDKASCWRYYPSRPPHFSPVITRRATLKIRSETQRFASPNHDSLQTPDIKPFPTLQSLLAGLLPGRNTTQVQQKLPLLAGDVGAHILEKRVSQITFYTDLHQPNVSMDCETYPGVCVDGQRFASEESAILPPSVFLALLGLNGVYLLGALLVEDVEKPFGLQF
jgi:hypothetical protein